tara:strand:- start:667 stop:918 length:252 start_codon:yes stop_codon:yes gene_type:complete
MTKDSSKDEKIKHFASNFVELPDFVEKFTSTNEVFSVSGTNVIRVPFGIRSPRRKRPEKNQKIATLVLPITSINSPTPPPHVA